ncbi:MAG: mitochondrial fission ELM1 family protein [Pseudomonadales bacterium]
MPDICIVSDGKPGHLNQSLGLVEALQRQRPDISYSLCAPQSLGALSWLVIRHLFNKNSLLPAKLVIAAGHRTHLTVLVYGWLLGAKKVLLMKPSLPLRYFDVCLIPEHDQPAAQPNIIETWGVLNRIVPAQKKVMTGLLLIGGPSKHFNWDEQSVLDQLTSILTKYPQFDWALTTSRRTPSSFLTQLQARKLNIKLIPHEAVGLNWLPSELAVTEHCWVTEDSVSMVYEALTAGCDVGLITLASHGEGRLHHGLARLRASNRVSSLQQPLLLDKGIVLTPFAEAQRCAALILKKGWL